MHCKRCGKAIGTDRGVCPFCGALLSKEQMEVFNKEHRFDNQMITEKYNGQKVYYEKRKETNTSWILFLIIASILLLFLFLIILFLIF